MRFTRTFLRAAGRTDSKAYLSTAGRVLALPGMDTSSNLPMHHYTKGCPPGWRPGVQGYPLKRYLDLLKIWYRLTDFNDSQVGPAAAGRFEGRALTLANELKIQKQDGSTLVGDAAVSFEGEPASAQNAASLSGLQSMIKVLVDSYGTTDQDQVA